MLELIGLCAVIVAAGIAVTVALNAKVSANRERDLERSDPFHVFDVQRRLAQTSAEILRIESDPTMLARAHHLRAALWAYDALLQEAWDLVSDDVATGPIGPTDPHAPADPSTPAASTAPVGPILAPHRAASAHFGATSVLANLPSTESRLAKELALSERGWLW